MYSSLRSGSRSWQSASLPGSARALERALADDQVARLAGSLPRTLGGHGLLDDASAVAGVLVEELAETLRHGRLDLALDLGVAELGLGLALELRLGELDADDGVRPSRTSSPERLSLESLMIPWRRAQSLRELVRAARKPVTWVPPSTVWILLAKARTVSAKPSLYWMRDLDGGRAITPLDGDGSLAQRLLVLVEVAHEARDAALEVERALPPGLLALIDEADVDAPW